MNVFIIVSKMNVNLNSAPVANVHSNRSSIAKVIAIIAIYTVHSAMRSNLSTSYIDITVSGFVSPLIICE